jgi:uncharacterized protein (TIGR02453 family)
MSSRGITTSARDFFVELEANNNKAWWAEHKSTYEDAVKRPFLELLTDLGAEYGPWRVYRPHRDTRFAADKAPYKTFIGAVTQLPSGNGFFIQISSKGLLLGSGYPMMAPDQLQKFRTAVAAQSTGSAFVELLAAEGTAGVRIFGGRYEPLKRNPKGFAAEHPRGEWLRWKGVEISQRLGWPTWLSTARAGAELRKLMQAGAPVTSWLDNHVGPSALTPEEIWGR